MIENISLGMGLDRLFQDILSFSFEFVGENVLYIVFTTKLERENWFSGFFYFSSGVLALSEVITELNYAEGTERKKCFLHLQNKLQLSSAGLSLQQILVPGAQQATSPKPVVLLS